MTWLVSFKTSKILEICFTKILRFNFLFKIFFTIQAVYCFALETVLRNTIMIRNRQQLKELKHFLLVKFILKRKRCLHKDKKIFYQRPKWIKLVHFLEKYCKFSKNYKNSNKLKQNTSYLLFRIERGSCRSIVKQLNSTDYFRLTK